MLQYLYSDHIGELVFLVAKDWWLRCQMWHQSSLKLARRWGMTRLKNIQLAHEGKCIFWAGDLILCLLLLCCWNCLLMFFCDCICVMWVQKGDHVLLELPCGTFCAKQSSMEWAVRGTLADLRPPKVHQSHISRFQDKLACFWNIHLSKILS